jgi:hypothetical protein
MDRASRFSQLVDCAQVVAEKADPKVIRAQHVKTMEHDLEIRRVLDAIIRRWSKFVPPAFESKDVSAIAAAKIHLDHIVPVRVLVDRMILKPADSADILRDAVVLARITAEQHSNLGGIFVNHQAIYEEMLEPSTSVAQLVKLGMRRYETCAVELAAIGPVSS